MLLWNVRRILVCRLEKLNYFRLFVLTIRMLDNDLYARWCLVTRSNVRFAAMYIRLMICSLGF
jgi:hypothetical protein